MLNSEKNIFNGNKFLPSMKPLDHVQKYFHYAFLPYFYIRVDALRKNLEQVIDKMGVASSKVVNDSITLSL